MTIKDAPDGTLWVQTVNVVVDTPTPSEPANEEAAGHIEKYMGDDLEYQTVASWTVEAGKLGELKEITLLSDNYDKTYWRVTIGDVVILDAVRVQAAMPLIFEDLKLAAGTIVKVECRTITGYSIEADAAIVGKEIG